MPTELRQHDLEMLRHEITMEYRKELREEVRELRDQIHKQERRVTDWSSWTVYGFMLTAYAFVVTWLYLADR